MESAPSILPLTVAVVATGHIQKRTRARNEKARPDRAGAEFGIGKMRSQQELENGGKD